MAFETTLKIGVDTRTAERSLQRVEGALARTGGAAVRSGRRISGAFDRARLSLNRTAAAAFSLKSAIGVVVAGLAVRKIGAVTARFEDLRTSLTAVFGSAQAGASAFERIQEIAATMPIDVETITKAFITLKASGVEPTAALLTQFSDTASVTTDRIGTFDAQVRILSRSLQGGLGLEELNQIADRGIPVWEILKDKLNVTRLEVAEVGKTAAGAKKVMAALSEGLSEKFGGATEKALGNLSTKLSNTGDAFNKMLDKLATSTGLINLFKGALDSTIFVLEAFSLGVERLGRSLDTIGTAIDVMRRGGTLDMLLIITGMDETGEAAQRLRGHLEELDYFKKAMEEAPVKIEATGDVEEISKETKDFIQTLKVQTEQLTLLESATRKSDQAVEDANDAILVQNALLKEGVGLQSVAGEQIAEAIVKNEGLKRSIEDITEARKADIEKQKEDFEAVKESLSSLNASLSSGASEAIKGVLLYGKTWKEVTGDIAKSIIVGIIDSLVQTGVQMATNFAIAQTFGAATVAAAAAEGTATALAWAPAAALASLATLGGNAAPAAAAITATTALASGAALIPRALGGPVEAGRGYLVGEKGPERFYPEENGTIVPNGGGSGGTVINIDARGSNGDAAVEAAVERGIRRAAPGLITASVNKVRDTRQRDPSFL